MTPHGQDSPTFSLRLALSYDAENVRIDSAQRVEMLAPTGESTLLASHSGAWIELRDAQETVLYQRVIRLPLRSVVEVAESPDTRRMTWHARPSAEGALNVVVPDLPGTATILVFSSPRDIPAAEAVVTTRVNRADLTGSET